VSSSAQTSTGTVRFGVVVFPGSNCDADAHDAIGTFPGATSRYLWHKDTDLGDLDCVILPGGFSYGDYLRSGAIAQFSPIMGAVKSFAEGGGLVLGICNGFQILLESGMLPGAMHQNEGLKFVCKLVTLKVENNETPFTSGYERGRLIDVPVAHHEGNYFIGPGELERLEANGQVVLRYCDKSGEATPAANPNGSLAGIAGVCNERRNVFGLMPHPERVCEAIVGGTDGRGVFESIIASVTGQPLGPDRS
jgi:phosphoribosylformylglycinamidine synthase